MQAKQTTGDPGQPRRRAKFKLAKRLKGAFATTSGATLLVFLLQLASSAFQEALAINSVLDLKGTFPYLIDGSTGRLTEPRDYMDFESIYAPNETYKRRQTAQGRNYHLLKAFDFANYFQSDYWHYSNQDDLRRSAEPVADEQRCGQTLDRLEGYLNQSERILFRPGEQHLQLMSLVDSFGHPEAGTYYGHGYWLGSYYQCLKVALNLRQLDEEEACQAASSGATDCQPLASASASRIVNSKPRPLEQRIKSKDEVRFRYCIGKAHDVDWPSPEEDNYVPRISYKIGLCLPETCQTLSFRERQQQIERLMGLNLPAYMRSRIKLHDMYCLPDRRSPIRQLSTSARLFLALCFGWLGLLLLATALYSCHKRHQRDLGDIMIVSSQHREEGTTTPADGTPNGHLLSNLSTGTAPTGPVVLASANGETKLLASSPLLLQVGSPSEKRHRLEIIAGGQSSSAPGSPLEVASGLSYKNSPSSWSLSTWLNDSPMTIRLLKALSIGDTLREFQQPPEPLRVPNASKKLRVNLNALDSIKCLCCILVIFGHIIFIHMQHLSNIVHTIELSHELYPRALIAFFNFVDTFFIISGLLTAYFVFKRFNKRTFSKPLIWFQISLLRLLRLSPVYLLIFWYVKTLSVYVSHGPIWDYGTDDKSTKGLCINDHWWKSVLYLGNLGTMQPLCILPAWSIIVDAQYSLFVPPVLFLIFKRKRLGHLLLLAAILVSTTKMSLQLANQTAVRTSDMAKIRLHVYPLISRFAAEFYNTAWNRIGPVAIGIFGGHMLYLYDVGTIRRWPWFMRGVSFKVVLYLHLFIFMLPAIGRFTDDPEKAGSDTDMTIFIMSNATIKPIWSLINTIFLLRLITDLRHHSVLARLMSHNIWHCLGKLCFTSYLIHYEIILTLLKSRQEGLVDPNWSNALREFSTAFLISTIISYFIYILYEAPINKLIMVFAENNRALRKDSLAGAATITTTMTNGTAAAANQSEGLLGEGRVGGQTPTTPATTTTNTVPATTLLKPLQA